MRFLFGLLALGLCATSRGQSPIQVNVNLVNAAFSARDSSGALATGLTKDDFELLEDGVPQAISFFSRGADLPLSLGLILDVSDSQGHFVKRHEHDLEAFLKDVLTPRDRAFLICFGNHLRLASDFSASSSEIAGGLKRFEKSMKGLPELGPPEVREAGTAFYDAIYYSTIEKLAPLEGGRKALIIFSDGEDNSSAHHMLDAIETAQSENVVIFAIRYIERKKGRLTARNKYGIRVMERIARDTGGLDYDAESTDLRKSFRAIGEELRSSYELAYHSTNPTRDGTFHKLVIRAKRPGLAVRAKSGYFSK